MKKAIVVILALILTALIVVAGVLTYQSTYLSIDGETYRRDLETLDLSGAPIGEPDKLQELKNLKQLDLCDTGLSAAQYEALQKALPDCHIRWLLPFQGSYLPLDTQEIKIDTLTQEEMALLRYLPDLHTVDATECRDYDMLLALQAQYPECTVLYRLTFGETVLEQDAASAALTSAADMAQALQYLPQLTAIQADGCLEFDKLLQLQAQYPDCSISYTVPFCGESWPHTTTQMTLQSTTAAELSQVLPYLPALQEVTVVQPIPDQETMLKLREAYPNISFTYSFELLGKTVNNRDTTLDISGIALESTDIIHDAMQHFVCMEKIDMCECGISDEEMGKLNEQYPDTLFVWTVKFGWVKLRTDITYFMPYQYGYKISDEDADTLKYLTELICLDFGHMPITRTDYLAYMTKMQYLLLADTAVTDISGAANMPDLKYCELFMTKIKDFSPLLACTKLEDLNICYTKPEDVSVFYQMTQLERLWFCGMYDAATQRSLRQALPDTILMFDAGSSTGGGWRESPNYYDMRDLLGMSYMTG